MPFVHLKGERGIQKLFKTHDIAITFCTKLRFFAAEHLIINTYGFETCLLGAAAGTAGIVKENTVFPANAADFRRFGEDARIAFFDPNTTINIRILNIDGFLITS